MTQRMNARDALAAVYAATSARDIVVTTMTPARDWMAMGVRPLDMVLVPSAMSHAPSMGLGLAIAQPGRRVIVCNGDGSMLMNLGSLVSIVNAGVTNLVVLVFDNGTYEVTGSQPVPGAGVVNYAAVARGCGFTSVFEFSDLDQWHEAMPSVLAVGGPTLVWLRVEPVFGQPGPKSPGPAAERATRFMDALRRT
ncbi:MAG TPA: thiamine pyrophosphate-dependent enzyme [Gemmatimonadaceae bacterium]|jgi:thiamine pyrophosphate-dependent acetolactate synthase large subunit-like protein|nr:thiamine pyrophosphate-dependent enzyme [Gemmatimonadaceae bacterium]